MSKLTVPKDYRAVLSISDTQRAIADVKRIFVQKLSGALNLRSVSAPLFVEAGTGILEALERGNVYQNSKRHQMEIGVTVLPHFPKDTTDRNRTSPFAFTGNKFEFCMPGSNQSIAEKARDAPEKAERYGKVISTMRMLREATDSMEMLVAKGYWELPNYAELMFGVI